MRKLSFLCVWFLDDNWPHLRLLFDLHLRNKKENDTLATVADFCAVRENGFL